MVQRPRPDLRGGCAAIRIRIPTATGGRGSATTPPTRPPHAIPWPHRPPPRPRPWESGRAAPGAMTHKANVPAVCGGAMGCNVSPGAAVSSLIPHAAAGPGVAVGDGAAGTPGPRPPGCQKRRSYLNLGDT